MMRFARSAELARPTMTTREFAIQMQSGEPRGGGKGEEGYRTGEDFCHSGSHSRTVPQRVKEPGGTHLPFSALTAAQQSGSFSLSSRVSPPLSPTPVASHFPTPGRPSRLLRCTDIAIPGCVPMKRALATSRLTYVSAYVSEVVFVLRVMLRLRYSPLISLLSLSLSYTRTQFRSLFLRSDLSGFDPERTMRPTAVQKCPKRM